MILLWLFTAVVGLVVATVALLLIALAVPVGVRVTRTVGNERAMVKAHWLWGVVRISLTGRAPHAPGRTKRARHRGTDRRNPRRAVTQDRSRRPAPEEIPVIVRAVLTLLKQVVRRFKVAADGEVHIGLSDPADTGILWGMSGPLLLCFTERVGLRVQPSFAGAEFSFIGPVAVDVVPLTVAAPLLRFVLSRDGRTVVRILRGRA